MLRFLCLFLISLPVFAKLPYVPIEFPRDDAAHYANTPYEVSNLMEWWYYNGLLTSESGRQFGYYLSFNYMYRAPHLIVPFIQLQITDIENKKVYGKQLFFYNYKISTSAPLDVTYGKNFSLQKINNQYHIEGFLETDDKIPLRVSLTFTPLRNVLLMTEKGLIDMWNDKNSYYYSYTRLMTAGYLQIGKETFPLNKNQSLSWMDHQWGDFLIIPGKNQWLWSSIQLTNGVDAMIGINFDAKTKKPVFGLATVLMPDGSKRYTTDVNDLSYIASPVEPGQHHATKYAVEIKNVDLHLTLDAFAPGQDVNGLWEGISHVTGTYQGESVTGQATTENSLM